MNFGHNQQNIPNSFKLFYEGMGNQHVNNQNINKEPTQQTSSNKIGHWSLRENAKYYAFLKKYKDRFSERQSRRQCKVFKALAQFMKTRNANQCRSHHHKMQKNFQTIEQNLSQLLKKNPSLDEKCQKYFLKLDKIEAIIFGQQDQQKTQKNLKQEPLKEEDINNHQQIQKQVDQQGNEAKKNPNQVMKTSDCYQNQPHAECEQNILKTISNKAEIKQLERNSINQPQEPQNYVQNFTEKQTQVHCVPKFSKIDSSQNYYQKLIQCHQYFIKWYEKVHEIMQEEQQQLKVLYRQDCYNPGWYSFHY